MTLNPLTVLFAIVFNVMLAFMRVYIRRKQAGVTHFITTNLKTELGISDKSEAQLPALYGIFMGKLCGHESRRFKGELAAFLMGMVPSCMLAGWWGVLLSILIWSITTMVCVRWILPKTDSSFWKLAFIAKVTTSLRCRKWFNPAAYEASIHEREHLEKLGYPFKDIPGLGTFRYTLGLFVLSMSPLPVIALCLHGIWPSELIATNPPIHHPDSFPYTLAYPPLPYVALMILPLIGLWLLEKTNEIFHVLWVLCLGYLGIILLWELTNVGCHELPAFFETLFLLKRL